jgi:conjugal transfer pilus assembly protein TrbC
MRRFVLTAAVMALAIIQPAWGEEPNDVKGEMEKLAEKITSGMIQGESADKVESAKEELKTGLFGKYLEKGGEATVPNNKPEGDRVYLFVSSSMPLATLRNYSTDAAKLGGDVVMVVRGLKGGLEAKWAPTMLFSRSILVEDPDCDVSSANCRMRTVQFEIDPLLFKRYVISRVPAVVYARGVVLADAGLSEGLDGNVKSGEAWVAYGDESLSGLLEEINRTANSQWLSGLAGRLKE